MRLRTDVRPGPDRRFRTDPFDFTGPILIEEQITNDQRTKGGHAIQHRFDPMLAFRAHAPLPFS